MFDVGTYKLPSSATIIRTQHSVTTQPSLPPSLPASDSVGESSESEPSEVFALLITCCSQFCQSLAFIVLAVVVPREPG